MSADARHSAEHAPALRDPVSQRALLLAVAAGPVAWITQLVTTYAFASHACNPSAQPPALPPPGAWPSEYTLMLAINLACLFLAFAGGGLAIVCWRRATAEHARFLAGCGVLTAAGFALAIAFNTAELFIVPACWRMLP